MRAVLQNLRTQALMPSGQGSLELFYLLWEKKISVEVAVDVDGNREGMNGYTSFGGKYQVETISFVLCRVACDATWGEGEDERGTNIRDILNKAPPVFRGVR